MGSHATWKATTTEAMRTAILDRCPVGTNLAGARSFLVSEGFECKPVEHGNFVERSSWIGAGQLHSDVDYMACRRFNRAGVLMTHVWDVAVVTDGTRVDDVIVSHYTDGP